MQDITLARSLRSSMDKNSPPLRALFLDRIIPLVNTIHFYAALVSTIQALKACPSIGPRGGKTNKEITAVKGKPLPPTQRPGERYVLDDPTNNKSGRPKK